MEEFRFFLITDTHFFKNSLGAYGAGYERHMEYEQKCFAETESIDRAAFAYLKESKEADTVLIAGDLTHNGEKASHEEFVKLLRELKESGKKIYVVTAGHDVKKDPFAFPGTDERVVVEGIKFADLYGYYRDFGYDAAIAFNAEHMSYVAQLADGIRLLVLCSDTAEGTAKAYDESFRVWIKEQLDLAKADGQMMIAMEHYPVLPGQPILSLIGDATQKEANTLVRLLADNGCHLIFTGHMHNQSINTVTTEKGNRFFDVCTGSAIGHPAFMRLCTVKDESTVEIKSIPVPDFDWDTNGKTCKQYLQDQFDSMIINLLTGMRDDPVRAMKKVGIKENKLLEKLLRRAGKALCENSVGKTARFFAVKADPSIADMPLIDLLTAVVRNVFAGDQPFTDKTPEGKVLLKIVSRFKPLLKIMSGKVKDSQGNGVDLYDIIKNSFGNYGISDSEAVLRLK